MRRADLVQGWETAEANVNCLARPKCPPGLQPVSTVVVVMRVDFHKRWHRESSASKVDLARHASEARHASGARRASEASQVL